MEQRTRSASELVAAIKAPRCFDARLVRVSTDALWGIDVGIPEDSTQLLVCWNIIQNLIPMANI